MSAITTSNAFSYLNPDTPSSTSSALPLQPHSQRIGKHAKLPLCTSYLLTPPPLPLSQPHLQFPLHCHLMESHSSSPSISPIPLLSSTPSPSSFLPTIEGQCT
ncbi:hypothetical protein E2C01_044377 [Portunus trituberculatus]|uniref:Uncharacterized protein n=1 Tax=Portunus trituberculatus TaxID=210409 RepID=A0A5B7G0A2_PORTR|nr:hypothetical protein [Portunus trituberculatus]